MIRLVSLAFASWFSLVVAVLNDEARDSAVAESVATTTVAEVVVTTLPPYLGEGGPEPEYHLETTTTTLPLPVWTGSIPEVYGEGSGCSQDKANIVARAMWDRGASDDSVKDMLRIISRESLCDSSAHNGNTRTRDDSWGLCQQNNLSGWFDEGKLLENYDRYAFADDFAYNAESCAVMWEECGVGPWNYGNYYCSTPRELR